MKYEITAKNGNKYATEDSAYAFAIYFAEANDIPAADYDTYARKCSSAVSDLNIDGPTPYGSLFDHVAEHWGTLKNASPAKIADDYVRKVYTNI